MEAKAHDGRRLTNTDRLTRAVGSSENTRLSCPPPWGSDQDHFGCQALGRFGRALPPCLDAPLAKAARARFFLLDALPTGGCGPLLDFVRGLRGVTAPSG